MFKSARTRVTVEGRSGQPSTSRSRKASISAGIQKLVEIYNKCIVLQGDYVEK